MNACNQQSQKNKIIKLDVLTKNIVNIRGGSLLRFFVPLLRFFQNMRFRHLKKNDYFFLFKFSGKVTKSFFESTGNDIRLL